MLSTVWHSLCQGQLRLPGQVSLPGLLSRLNNMQSHIVLPTFSSCASTSRFSARKSSSRRSSRKSNQNNKVQQQQQQQQQQPSPTKQHQPQQPPQAKQRSPVKQPKQPPAQISPKKPRLQQEVKHAASPAKKHQSPAKERPPAKN